MDLVAGCGRYVTLQLGFPANPTGKLHSSPCRAKHTLFVDKPYNFIALNKVLITVAFTCAVHTV